MTRIARRLSGPWKSAIVRGTFGRNRGILAEATAGETPIDPDWRWTEPYVGANGGSSWGKWAEGPFMLESLIQLSLKSFLRTAEMRSLVGTL